MTTNKFTASSGKPVHEPFATIDDAIALTQQVHTVLKKLAEYKHPLAVRRARKEVIQMQEGRESKQVRAGNRTYFIDVETSKEGKRYLRITESRFKGEDQERERSSIVIFPEEAGDFVSAVSEMAAKLL